MKEALRERGRYTLVDVGGGYLAYRVNPTPTLGGAGKPGLTEADHYICQKRFDGPTKVKVVLQPSVSGWLRCNACKINLGGGGE